MGNKTYAVVVKPAPGRSVLIAIAGEKRFLSLDAAEAVATRILGTIAKIRLEAAIVAPRGPWVEDAKIMARIKKRGEVLFGK